MDGYRFEKRCAAMLRRQGFTHVILTGGSGDQGVDILARKHRKKYGIQCKYYSHPVGNKAVQEAYAGAKYYECDVAAVMTNSTYTEAAMALAEKTGVRLWHTEARGFGCWKHVWWVSLAGALFLALVLWLLLPWCIPPGCAVLRRLASAAGRNVFAEADLLPAGLLRIRACECALAAAGSILCIGNRRSRLLMTGAGILSLAAIGCELFFREQTGYTQRQAVLLLLAMAGTAFPGAFFRTAFCRADIREEEAGEGEPGNESENNV